MRKDPRAWERDWVVGMARDTNRKPAMPAIPRFVLGFCIGFLTLGALIQAVHGLIR